MILKDNLEISQTTKSPLIKKLSTFEQKEEHRAGLPSLLPNGRLSVIERENEVFHHSINMLRSASKVLLYSLILSIIIKLPVI